MIYRYAIYYIPDEDSQLFAAGSALLGYNIRSGQNVPAPMLPLPVGLTWNAMVEDPQRYGLHATVVAPFLPRKADENALLEALGQFCRGLAPIRVPLKVVEHRNFIALMADSCPSGGEAHAALRQMAGEAVRRFAIHRQKPDAAEAARHAMGLNQRQAAMLQTWGYPYVFEEYDFHISLTGPYGRLSGLREVLAAYLKGCTDYPQTVSSLSLCRQPVERNHKLGQNFTGRFTVLETFPFGNGAAQEQFR